MTVQNNQLPLGTQLSHYQINKTLSAGGFGIVYLAVDRRNDQPVVIKEYLPNKLAKREADLNVVPRADECISTLNEGRQLFLLEVSALKKLNHPNIVHITDSFDAFNTVYIVMDYRPGENLQNILSQHGTLTEPVIRRIFPPLIDGVRLVHANNLLHLDIKPGNILIQQDGNPILLDFGAVIRKNMSRTMQPRPVITPGFSPVEQHDPKGYCGPWTDIYAIAATIRTCIEGHPPPKSTERQEQDRMKPAAVAFKRKYSASLLEAIDSAMEVDALLRPQTIEEFMEAFGKAGNVEAGGFLQNIKKRWSWGKAG
ncbi:MAG: serine/threonine-protein kinase [Gammaproteobacteria bacterium]|jgi:serine/threonine protein kinase